MRLGFIGFGEVSYELSYGFKSEGVNGIVAFEPYKDDPKYGPFVRERAALAAVTLLPTPRDVVEAADIIIAAVPGSRAMEAAESVLDALDKTKIYADVSTSSPTMKARIADKVAQTGAGFVDGALMGGLTQQHHKVHTLISGSGADRFMEQMAVTGMNLSKVSDKAGDAIAVKLVRSIYMKGLATLQTEMLEAAYQLQVQDIVCDSIADSVESKSFRDLMNFLVPASAIHAERQTHEMADCMTMLQDLGIMPTMTEATMKKLQWLADQKLKDKFGGKAPTHVRDVIQVFGK